MSSSISLIVLGIYKLSLQLLNLSAHLAPIENHKPLGLTNNAFSSQEPLRSLKSEIFISLGEMWMYGSVFAPFIFLYCSIYSFILLQLIFLIFERNLKILISCVTVQNPNFILLASLPASLFILISFL